MGTLTIDKVRKQYGAVEVLKEVSIDVAHGEFIVLVGPSGCGKSTLLNSIAGLENLTTGEISIDGNIVNNVSPKDRDIAMVFQSYALYPNMNVRQNLSFGLETRKVEKSERERIIDEVSKTLQIEALLDRKPSQLSGGQRQRVAMGRALARKPSIYLFDEPLSNLDAKLRVEMRTEIKKLHSRVGTTIVYVTHDQIEAMTLADRIAVMKDGIIQQLDTPQEVYDKPANRFVAGFIGSPSMNFIDCPVVEFNNTIGIELKLNGKTFTIPFLGEKSKLERYLKQTVTLGIRPEQIAHGFSHEGDAKHFHDIICRVNVLEPTGPDTLVFTTINDQEVTCRVHPEQVSGPGTDMELTLDMSKALFFDPDTGDRIA